MKRRNLFGCKISKEPKIDGHMLDSIQEDYYIPLIDKKNWQCSENVFQHIWTIAKREFPTLGKTRYFGKFSLREDVD